MRKVILLVIAVYALFFAATAKNAAAQDDKWTRLVAESGRVLAEVQDMPDQKVPEDLLRKCAGIAVFPSTMSGGFVIGGRYGQGIIMARNERTGGWSSPAIFTMAGGSFGWQIGGQATDFILLIMNRRSIDGLLQGKFKLGVDASAAAGPVGRAADASTDIQLKGGILSYSRSRGLFAGAKLEGDAITPQYEANRALYGNTFSEREIVFENKAPMPRCADLLLSTLNRYTYKR